MAQEQIPPHDMEAEQAVLGACMQDKTARYEVLERVRENDFYNAQHKEIFGAIQALEQAGSAVDILTVCDELKHRKALDAAGGRAYVADLPSKGAMTANVASYVDIVVEKAERRHLIEAALEILKQSYSNEGKSRDVMERAEQSIFRIAENRQRQDMVPLKDILSENMRMLDERAAKKGELSGVPTGLIDLDRETNGLQRSNLLILAGRPSMGKTAFALTVARNAAEREKKVAFFSLEMDKYDLSQRLISMEAGVDAQKLRSGELSDDDWQRIAVSMDALSKALITIDDSPGLSVMEIKNKCRRLKSEKGLDLVVVDYLQLLSHSAASENRALEVAADTRGLKQLARELECPVLVLSQLNREVEKQTGSRPKMSNLRESGSIEQDADVILFLHREDYQGQETEHPGECEVIIAKQRNGPTGSVFVRWQQQYARFVNKSYQ